MAQDVTLDVDDEVLERLNRRAAAEGKSLEQFLRDALTGAATAPSPAPGPPPSRG